RARASDEAKGWSPAPESLAIYSRIQGLRELTDVTGGVEGPVGDLDPPLCGRSEELSRLSRCLATLPQGPLTTILVSGEGGIGKTRLVEESLKSAPLRGLRVFSAQSAEFERPIPLNPLLDALDHPEVGAALARLDDPWRTVLLALMPQFHRGEGPVPEAPYVQPDSVPRRLFEAIHHLFSELVGEGPVLLFLDDFQWADDTTLAVLQFLQRRWQAGRLILLMAYRPESRYVEEESVARFLKTVREGKRTEEIHLDDLTPAASGDLVTAVATGEISERDLNSLCTLGGNNPFFLIELTVEHLAGRLNTNLQDRDLILLPQSIRQILTRRFSELSEDADAVLALLAVISRPIDFRDISAISSQSEESCISAVEQLLRFRLVQRVTRGLRVRHELIRQAVYGGLSESRRAWLHERVALHLLKTEDPPPVDQLAVHFHNAGVEDQALHFSTRAADAAEISGAVPEAIRYLKIAREHAHDPEAAAEITGKLGHLHYLYLNYGEAVPLLEFASSRLRAQGCLADALRYDVERVDAISHG
ncbi:MAG: AAA family ATPase, partial [Gemmatimonadetes bacterium]|nr:AAA family ATPase [Gemmatimonadota bacterium]